MQHGNSAIQMVVVRLIKRYRRRQYLKKSLEETVSLIAACMNHVMFRTPQVIKEVNRLMRYRTRLKRLLSGKSPWRD